MHTQAQQNTPDATHGAPAPSTPDGAPEAPASERHGLPPVLLESLVALALMLSLSGIVMPAVADSVAQGRLVDCQADMQDIARGLAAYSADTLYLPTGREGRTNIAWLYGPGELPTGNTLMEGGEGRALDDALMSDVMGGQSWHGPYVAELTPDPWGRAYLVNVDGWISARETPMILSAGPNGQVETDATENRPGGDDVLLLLD